MLCDCIFNRKQKIAKKRKHQHGEKDKGHADPDAYGCTPGHPELFPEEGHHRFCCQGQHQSPQEGREDGKKPTDGEKDGGSGGSGQCNSLGTQKRFLLSAFFTRIDWKMGLLFL